MLGPFLSIETSVNCDRKELRALTAHSLAWDIFGPVLVLTFHHFQVRDRSAPQRRLKEERESFFHSVMARIIHISRVWWLRWCHRHLFALRSSNLSDVVTVCDLSALSVQLVPTNSWPQIHKSAAFMFRHGWQHVSQNISTTIKLTNYKRS